MKKGIMLSFLFWTLVALIIFVPSVLWASDLIDFNTKAEESFENLVATIESVDNDGEIESTPLYLEDKSIIVGFSKYSNRFENHEYFYSRANPDALVFTLNRPESCENEKACICACTNFNFKITGADIYSPECEKPICKSFSDLDFLSEKVVRTYGNGKPQFSWKGGFLYLRSVPAVANGLVQNRIGTRTFYAQRYRNIIDICTESPCISEDAKQVINAQPATN